MNKRKRNKEKRKETILFLLFIFFKRYLHTWYWLSDCERFFNYQVLTRFAYFRCFPIYFTLNYNPQSNSSTYIQHGYRWRISLMMLQCVLSWCLQLLAIFLSYWTALQAFFVLLLALLAVPPEQLLYDTRPCMGDIKICDLYVERIVDFKTMLKEQWKWLFRLWISL